VPSYVWLISSEKGPLDMTQAWQLGTPKDHDELQRSINRLQFVSRIGYASLPIALLGAGLGATVAPIAFPIVAGTAAVAVGIGEAWARRERARLDASIKAMETRRVISAEEAKALTATANTVTVAGSSSST